MWKSDEPAADAMNFLGVLSREDDAVIGGRRNEEHDRHREASEAGGVEQFRADGQLLK